MIVEFLVKRAPRERWILVAGLLLLSVVACYSSAIGPSLETLDGVCNDVDTTQMGLDFQQQQLRLLRTETDVCQKTLDRLKDVPCPWLEAAKVDSFLQELQTEAAELGLSVRSIARERGPNLKPRDPNNKTTVSLQSVRMELCGPYAGVLEMLRRLSKRSLAIGLEDLAIKGIDEPPYDVEVAIVMRLPVV